MISEPTDKRLFRGNLIAGILSVLMCIICVYASRFGFTFFLYILAFLFLFLGIFNFIIYAIKPKSYRERLLRHREKRRVQKESRIK